MKNNIVWYILIISIILLVVMIIYITDINYISQEDGQIEVIGKKELLLKDKQKNVLMPHLNIKGRVKDINSNCITIEFSDYAKTYLKTTQITTSNENFDLKENQTVFVMFKDINIEETKLYYSSLQIYKYIEKIELNNVKKDFYICKNDYDGFMRVDGISFKYNNNVYFICDDDLSQDNQIYFLNIKNGVLLIEQIKSILFPFKIYNIVNPQETKFNDIVEIYINKGSIE